MSISHNQIWMSLDNDDGSMAEGFQIPYNPESYKVVEGSNEKTVSVAGLGSVTVKSGKSPLTISFSSFFSSEAEPGLELEDEGDLLTPNEYDQIIRRWKNGTQPVHLVITNTNINGYFSISTYTAEEEGGDVGKIQYTLSLKQYGSGASGNGTLGSGNALIRRIDVDPYNLPSVPETYAVQKNDTLQSIAKYFYGDSAMAYEIYKLNSDTLKKGVNSKLKKKQVLYLPRQSS